MRMKFVSALVLGAVATAPAASRADARPDSLDAEALKSRVLATDPLGLGGAEVDAKIGVVDPSGHTRALRFDARSRRYAAPLSKSVIVFKAPADVAGMKFLQVQRGDTDDDRFLYTPDLRRARRVAASTRAESFMGTDFSYADLDGRDLRESQARRLPDEKIGKDDYHRLDLVPTASSAVYGRIQLWVRKDNYVPIRWVMLDKTGARAKTLSVAEASHVQGRWFVTRSRMLDARTGRSSELVLDRVVPRDDIPLEKFTVTALEQE